MREPFGFDVLLSHLVIVLCIAAVPAIAQTAEDKVATDEAAATVVASSGQETCSAPEYRQFDFWLGEWDVSDQRVEREKAFNRITSIHGGCVVLEEFEAPASRFSGTSLNFYDRKSAQWHQTWIDNHGQPLFLAGGLVEDRMVLISDADKMPIQRIAWTPNKDGSVRQHWESSEDGATWKTAFDGLYVKRK